MTKAETATDPHVDATKSFPNPSVQLDLSKTSGHDSESDRPALGEDLAALHHERFQIGAKLGEGGMGVVYRALDTLNGREVALKLMKGSLAGTARRRFE